MILPPVRLGVSMILSAGDTPSSPTIAVNIMGGGVWERRNVLRNDSGWLKDPLQQPLEGVIRPRGPEDWELAKLRYQSEDLGLIPWDVVRTGRFRLGLRWDRSRSWPCFALDDVFLVDGENLVTSFRR